MSPIGLNKLVKDAQQLIQVERTKTVVQISFLLESQCLRRHTSITHMIKRLLDMRLTDDGNLHICVPIITA